jgi:CelD/BcsL family acetyltransferase involved in cellulose biosynthesis
MYNVRLGGTEYNIQSGFDATQSKGISPGYLHFGYALENACEQSIATFDFLAGKGLHRDYKRDFCTQPRPLVTLQSIRARALAWIYKEYDKRFLRSLGALAPPIGLLADAMLSLDAISDTTAGLY